MKTFLDTFDGITIALSTMFGLSQIENIIGVIVLCLQGLILISKLIYNIYKKLKNKDINGAIEYIEETVDALENLKEEVKNDD